MPKDEDYKESWGALERGNLIENHFWEPGLVGGVPDGVAVEYSGSSQKTLVSGFLSATPDGLVTGLPRDCLKDHPTFPVDDIGEGGCIVAECKSIDPRVPLDEAKQENVFQTHVQMGLIRELTNFKPEYALITYTNASWVDSIKEFGVKFNEKIFDAARHRANRIMGADDPKELPAEGKMSGGKECGYCPWSSHCAHIEAAGVPKDVEDLTDDSKEALYDLIMAQTIAKGKKEEYEKAYAQCTEHIKDFLRTKNTRKVVGDDWSVTYFPVKGRQVL